MDILVDAQAGTRRRKRRSRTRQFDAIEPACGAILVIVVLVSALAVGSVHPEALLSISALALIGGVLSIVGLRRRIPIPVLVLAALAAFSLLQALPLPARFVTWLSPANAAVWLGSLSPLHEPAPRWFSTSLDASASLAESLKWLTYAAVYQMAAQVRTRRGSVPLASLLFCSAVLVSGITLLHGAANLQTLYGIYTPSFSISRWSMGPLLNSNNFAGYCNIGLFAGLGLLLSRRPGLPPIPTAAGLCVIVAGEILSGSRAGISSAIVGGAAVLIWLSVSRQATPWTRRFVPLIGAVSVGTVALVARASGTIRTARPIDIERKIAVWRWTVAMIKDHPWLGTGRGAFETALPPYRAPLLTEDWTALHTHAENFPLQWLADWGIPVGGAALVVAVGYVTYQWYGARVERLRFLLLTGLCVLLLQNLADLGIEIPAIAIAAVVGLAAGDSAPKQVSTSQSSTTARTAVAVSVPLAIVWTAALLWTRSPVDLERSALSLDYHRLSVTSAEDRASFRTELRHAIKRHPGEAHFPLLGALVAYRARDSEPMPWIARALELAPTNGRVHLVLAEFLGEHGLTSQAMLHLKLAATYDDTLGGVTSSCAAQWGTNLDVLLESVPPTKDQKDVLALTCSKVAQQGLRIECFRRAVSTGSGEGVHGQLVEALLNAVESHVAPCADEAAATCSQEAEQLARTMARRDPHSWRPGYLLGRIFLLAGNADAAAEILMKACPGNPQAKECRRELVTAALATKRDQLILSAADRYTVAACADSAECATAFDWVGAALEASKKGILAVTFYTKAAEADGSSERWSRVAEHAANAQLFGLANAALDRADHSADADDGTRARNMLLRGRVRDAAMR